MKVQNNNIIYNDKIQFCIQALVIENICPTEIFDPWKGLGILGNKGMERYH